MENSQTRGNLEKAKKKVDNITNEDTKNELNDRINRMEQAIVIVEAQSAIENLENNKVHDNIQDAQDKTALVADSGSKADLENHINTVTQEIEQQEQEQQAQQEAEQQEAIQDDRIVYVTGGGKSDVYWYGTNDMPWNTNKDNIVTMTESEAIAAGKRHSLTE